jgi:redox-sensitive bicupin YhaK (pirin superfamily)
MAGKTLRELIEGDPLDWRRAFEILVATCHAVADARARGAAELSLEPESFYVESRTNGCIVTILDADLAPDTPRDTEVTAAMPWVVQPRCDYYSPEKIMGKPLRATSDVYTLGTIAFELVTGRLPFAEARGPALITMMLKREPPAPSAEHPEIPRAVDAVLLACLAKDPNKRYPDVHVLAQAAAHVLATEPAAKPVIKRARAAKAPATKPRTPPVRIFNGQTCGSATCKTRHRFRTAADRTLAGSWLFLDHFDSAVSMRPDQTAHPHMGVAVLSYLFEGRLVHRDSLGNQQLIKPNTLSWFHAGRGVVHSDRQHPNDRARGARLHGLELWVVLPRPNEDDPPAYVHHRAGELPSCVISGARVRVVLGEGYGVRSPVVTPAPLSLFDVRLPKGAAVPLPAPRHHDYQRAVYVVAGAVEVCGKLVEARQLAVIAPTAAAGVTAAHDAPAHVVVLGSAPVIGPRHSWWYFSASSKARVEDAKQRYAAGEFGALPGDAPPPLPRG